MQTHPSPHPSPLRYVFSVAAGVLPVSLNISHAGAAGTKRSAPVLGRSNARQRRESGKSQAPGPADVAAAETAAPRIIRGAQRTLNRYALRGERVPVGRVRGIWHVPKFLHGHLNQGPPPLKIRHLLFSDSVQSERPVLMTPNESSLL